MQVKDFLKDVESEIREEKADIVKATLRVRLLELEEARRMLNDIQKKVDGLLEMDIDDVEL